MHVPSVKQFLPEHAPCSSMQKRGTRGATKGVCRGEQIEIPKKAHGKSFLRKEAVSWMEHEARNGGLHIHHQMCNHRGERVIASYHVDGVSVSWLPLAWMCKVLSRKASENDHFCKEETMKERVDKRDAVCMNAGKEKSSP